MICLITINLIREGAVRGRFPGYDVFGVEDLTMPVSEPNLSHGSSVSLPRIPGSGVEHPFKIPVTSHSLKCASRAASSSYDS